MKNIERELEFTDNDLFVVMNQDGRQYLTTSIPSTKYSLDGTALWIVSPDDEIDDEFTLLTNSDDVYVLRTNKTINMCNSCLYFTVNDLKRLSYELSIGYTHLAITNKKAFIFKSSEKNLDRRSSKKEFRLVAHGAYTLSKEKVLLISEIIYNFRASVTTNLIDKCKKDESLSFLDEAERVAETNIFKGIQTPRMLPSELNAVLELVVEGVPLRCSSSDYIDAEKFGIKKQNVIHDIIVNSIDLYFSHKEVSHKEIEMHGCSYVDNELAGLYHESHSEFDFFSSKENNIELMNVILEPKRVNARTMFIINRFDENKKTDSPYSESNETYLHWLLNMCLKVQEKFISDDDLVEHIKKWFKKKKSLDTMFIQVMPYGDETLSSKISNQLVIPVGTIFELVCMDDDGMITLTEARTIKNNQHYYDYLSVEYPEIEHESSEIKLHVSEMNGGFVALPRKTGSLYFDYLYSNSENETFVEWLEEKYTCKN